MFQKIEEILKSYSLYCIGDEEYISKYNRNLKINIKLYNGHYKLLFNENRTKTKGILFKPI